jgi:hypothetical protein
MKGASVAVASLALLGSAAGSRAQEPQPGVVTMRFYECGLADLGAAVDIMNGDWRAIAVDLVEEGRLIEYGILTHSWGDEWNLVDYWVATDAAAFQRAFSEFVVRAQRQDPDGDAFAEFAALCPRHKDNQYSVVPPR